MGDIYRHEMPGGQYTNLFQQAQAVGLESRWTDVVSTYAEVNQLFGDVIKVTPTSKVVGDMALFMVANRLTPRDVLESDRELSYPESVVEFFEGRLGQPPGGFPPELQRRILRGRKPLTERPGPPCRPPISKRRVPNSKAATAGPKSAIVILSRTCSIRKSWPSITNIGESSRTWAFCPHRSFSTASRQSKKRASKSRRGKR